MSRKKNSSSHLISFLLDLVHLDPAVPDEDGPGNDGECALRQLCVLVSRAVLDLNGAHGDEEDGAERGVEEVLEREMYGFRLAGYRFIFESEEGKP